MQSPRVAPVDLRQFQLVYECQEEVIGGMQVLQGKVPMHRGLQFCDVDPFGNARDLANANETPIANDSREQRLVWGPRPGIFDLPGLKGVEKARETVDGREDFDQRNVVLLGQECAYGG